MSNEKQDREATLRMERPDADAIIGARDRTIAELLDALEELEDAASVSPDSRVEAARRVARAAIARATEEA